MSVGRIMNMGKIMSMDSIKEEILFRRHHIISPYNHRSCQVMLVFLEKKIIPF